MARYGFIVNQDSDLIIREVDGNTPMRAGPGFRIMNGDGLLSTMADGNMMIIMADGSGYPIMNGHLPGSAGVKAAITMDGHPWGLA